MLENVRNAANSENSDCVCKVDLRGLHYYHEYYDRKTAQ